MSFGGLTLPFLRGKVLLLLGRRDQENQLCYKQRDFLKSLMGGRLLLKERIVLLSMMQNDPIFVEMYSGLSINFIIFCLNLTLRKTSSFRNLLTGNPFKKPMREPIIYWKRWVFWKEQIIVLLAFLEESNSVWLLFVLWQTNQKFFWLMSLQEIWMNIRPFLFLRSCFI